MKRGKIIKLTVSFIYCSLVFLAVIACLGISETYAEGSKDKHSTKKRKTTVERAKDAEAIEWKDNEGIDFSWAGKDLAVLFNRRIEFYKIPKEYEAWVIQERYEDDTDYRKYRIGVPFSRAVRGKITFIKGSQESLFKPHKVVRFNTNIVVDTNMSFAYECPCECLLVGSDDLRPYDIRPKNWNEETDLEAYKQVHGRARESQGKEGRDYFYGMYQVDGTLIFKIDDRSSLPKHILRPWYVDASCSRAVFMSAEKVDWGYQELGRVNEVYVWTKQDGNVKRLKLKDAIRHHPWIKEISSYESLTRMTPGPAEE